MLRLRHPAFTRLAGVFLVGALLCTVTATLSASSAQAATSTTTVGLDGSDVSDFVFDSFDAEYTLGLDEAGRSTLATVETIVAKFPDSDQNRGIRRAIPTHYQGHPTEIVIEQVTDENGAARSFTTETSSEDRDEEFLEVTIAADDFVHGVQTYSITYSQTNVTLFPDVDKPSDDKPSDGKTEQFYWDVNGTGWDQPFGRVSATVRFEPELAGRLKNESRCYQGALNSKVPCSSIRLNAEPNDPVVRALATELAPRENLTIVVFFEPGTFVPRDDSFTANALPTIGLVGAILGLMTAIYAGVLRMTRWRPAAGRLTIIAEYLPPRSVNLLTAGNVTATAGKAMAAQFVSFAVRGNVRILEADDKKNHFLLEFVHAQHVDETESRILGKLFPGLRVGDRRDLKQKSAPLTTALQKEQVAAKAESLRLGLREKKNDVQRVFLYLLAVVFAGVAMAGGLGAVITVVGGFWPVLIITVSIVSAVATFIFASNFRPLTRSGAELRDYLKGVKLYIGLAEADRIRVLQSPHGALRSVYRPEGSPTQASELRSLQIVKLYERVLPFAVLFGQEKEWSGVLGQYYATNNIQPDWYVGSGVFQAAYFAGAIGSFSAATTSSWSGSAASSSSSGGGGFSGGGGGGGGGGGV